MLVVKSLIAASVSAVLLAGVPASVVAKTATEEDSVRSWGRWAVLAPAAGREESLLVPAGTGNLDRCASATNCPGPVAQKDPEPETPVDPPIDPPIDPPEQPKAGGEPKGYARIDYREAGSAQTFPRYFGDIVLNNDGDGHHPVLDEDDAGQTLAFRVAGQTGPGEGGFNVGTEPLQVSVTPDRFRSPRGAPFFIDGRYLRDVEGNLVLVEGTWWQTGENGDFRRSGEYVWGITASEDQLSSLMGQLGGELKGVYRGATATGGTIGLEMNFTQATWTGDVQGRVLDFQAGGTMDGAFFESDPTQFSSNIRGGRLEGALVNGGQDAIGGFQVKTHGDNPLQEADVFRAGLVNGQQLN